MKPPWKARRGAYVIAEIGINANGDVNLAGLMIKEAAKAGADCVKFQKRTPELCIPPEQWDERRSTPWGNISYIKYKRRTEFSAEDYDALQLVADEAGVEFTASAWDLPSLDFLERLEVPWIKIPSAKLTDRTLIEAAEKTLLPIVLSTGMSTPAEIKSAVDLLKDPGDHALLHCNSTYPAENQDLNLRCIQSLKLFYPDITIGYSGHERGIQTTVAAVVLGAEVVERHFTLDRTMWGSDQAASLEPKGFAQLVRDIRAVEDALGDGVKRVYPGELPAKRKLRGE